MPKVYLIGLLLFVANASARAQHWETVVDGTSTFKYLDASSEPSSDWNQAGFNDSSWPSGHGGFGYGDGDDATVVFVDYSLYLRKEFTINDLSEINRMLLDVDYDDAFVAYLNGQEIGRSFNISGNPPPYNASVSIDKEAVLYTGGTPERHEFDVSTFLMEGANVLAVQVVNVDPSSSDFSALPYLNAEINSPSIVYGDVPSWFVEPTDLTSSNLPIMIIDTQGGATITKEFRLDATMKLDFNQSGDRYQVAGPFNNYDGLISIKGRGSSSWDEFDKKGYGFETRLADGENNNVSLLGMPAENDWILHGPFADKTLMKNAFVYRIGQDLARYSPRTHFCEVILNGNYRGVYLLVERIKRDKNRLDIANLKPEDISGDELTGGYILSVDRADDEFWEPLIDFNNNFSVYNYVSPDPADMAQVQKDYIRNYVTDFERSLLQESLSDTENGYRAYINVTSFIDHYLMSELTKNIDAYRLSTYFYKDKDSKGGKLTMGPLWDYNFSCGGINIGYGDWGAKAENWIYDEYSGQPFWWQKFLQDPYYTSCLKQRWSDLRESTISESSFNSIIDEFAALLDEAKDRNFEVFPLEDMVWGNNHGGFTYEEEVDTLKGFLAKRIAWMDGAIAGLSGSMECTECFECENDGGVLIANVQGSHIIVYPNPFGNQLNFLLQTGNQGELTIKLYDLTGKVLKTKTIMSEGMNPELSINTSSLEKSGLLFYSVEQKGQIIGSGRVLRN